MPTELDRIREACQPQEYRALGLAECCTIADHAQAAAVQGHDVIPGELEYLVGLFPRSDPRDVRQCAEEALERIRKGNTDGTS